MAVTVTVTVTVTVNGRWGGYVPIKCEYNTESQFKFIKSKKTKRRDSTRTPFCWRSDRTWISVWQRGARASAAFGEVGGGDSMGREIKRTQNTTQFEALPSYVTQFDQGVVSVTLLPSPTSSVLASSHVRCPPATIASLWRITCSKKFRTSRWSNLAT